MILSEDPNINQTQHIFVFIYCKKVEGGGGETGKKHVQILIMKDKILRLNFVLIPKIKRQLKSKTYIYTV